MKYFSVCRSLSTAGALLARGTIALLAAILIVHHSNAAQPASAAASQETARASGTSAVTNLVIGWANLQWPPTMNHTISVTNRTENIYGQLWIDGVTSQPGATSNLVAQLGFGPQGSNPNGNADWLWVDGAFNVDVGNNDEFKATVLPEMTGSFDYVYRYSTSGGKEWLYADLNGPIAKAQVPPKPGKLTVKSSDDTTPPVTPSGLLIKSATPTGIALAWNSIADDSTMYGYEVLRSGKPGGPYAMVARVTGASYNDAAVQEGATNYYVVRSVDQSFNRSRNSSEASAMAGVRKVTVTFNLTVPNTTEATARSVNIAGNLEGLEGGFHDWDPNGAGLSRVNATQWTITLTGKEGAHLEYKFALGSWDYVEKSATCDEVPNRELTLTYGTAGKQAINDTVLKWRSVAPCGN